MTDFLPCPFCGGRTEEDRDSRYCVHGCGLQVQSRGATPSMEEWNTRTIAADPAGSDLLPLRVRLLHLAQGGTLAGSALQSVARDALRELDGRPAPDVPHQWGPLDDAIEGAELAIEAHGPENVPREVRELIEILRGMDA